MELFARNRWPLPAIKAREQMSEVIPADPNYRLRRTATAEALTEAGFPVSAATLATKATRGGGPPFERFGRVPLYRWSDALQWAASKLSGPYSSSSEADGGDANRRFCSASNKLPQNQ